MLTNALLLIAGFVFLIYGADYLVKGSASIARQFGVRTFVIGLTVVAFGTSAPEFVVNVLSATTGSTGLAIGNIFGSNIANILLILGVAAMIVPLTVERGTIWKEIPFSLMGAILIVVMGSDLLLDGIGPDRIGRIDGILLLSFFIIFLYYTYGISKAKGEKGPQIDVLPTWKSALFVFGGLAGLVIGGKFIVDSASDIARVFGLSEHLIGLSIVAVGTSLPELVTAVVAALKKQVDLAVGNVVGSNIFNIFFVLGTTSTVSSIEYGTNATQDGMWLLGVSLLLFFSLFIGRKQEVERWQGAIFVAFYVLYIGASIYRG